MTRHTGISLSPRSIQIERKFPDITKSRWLTTPKHSMGSWLLSPVARKASAQQWQSNSLPGTTLPIKTFGDSNRPLDGQLTVFSCRGALVVTNYPHASLEVEAATTLAKIRCIGGKHANECFAIESDLSTLEGPKHLIEEVVKRTNGRNIDILVNNAGRAAPQSLRDVTIDQWEFQINLNGRGTLLTTQAVLPHLAKGGRIVNLSSGGARQPYPGTSIYNGTKSMIESFTRCWAV